MDGAEWVETVEVRWINYVNYKGCLIDEISRGQEGIIYVVRGVDEVSRR